LSCTDATQEGEVVPTTDTTENGLESLIVGAMTGHTEASVPVDGVIRLKTDYLWKRILTRNGLPWSGVGALTKVERPLSRTWAIHRNRAIELKARP
jgi:hypothetical protein